MSKIKKSRISLLFKLFKIETHSLRCLRYSAYLFRTLKDVSEATKFQ